MNGSSLPAETTQKEERGPSWRSCPLAYRHQPDIDLRRSLSRPQLGRRSSYTDQLGALRSHLRDGTPSPRPDDALDTMRLIDACCDAGFGPAPLQQPPLA